MKISFKIILIYFFIFFYILLNKNVFIQKRIFSIDKISFILIVLIIIVFFITFSRKAYYYLSHNKLFCLLIFSSFISIFIFFISFNFIIFFISFEISVIPIFLIILIWGYQTERIQARLYLFFYIAIFRFPFLIILLLFLNFNFSRNWFLDWNFKTNIFISTIVFLPFLVKRPLYFFHLWLPKAHVEAPIIGSILLAGILLKLGTYGFFRLLYIFFFENLYFLFCIFFLISTRLRILICLLQTDQKAIIAYASVNHIRIVLIRVIFFSFFSKKIGIIIIFLHGIVSSLMFFFRYVFSSYSQNRLIFLNQGFLIFSICFSLYFIIFLLFNFNVPPTRNFFCELIIFFSVFLWNWLLFFLISLIIIVGCFYSLFLIINSIHGKQFFTFVTFGFNLHYFFKFSRGFAFLFIAIFNYFL